MAKPHLPNSVRAFNHIQRQRPQRIQISAPSNDLVDRNRLRREAMAKASA